MDLSMIEIFFQVFTLQNLTVLMIGVVGGMVVGALPGLTAVMAIALLIPFTFGMPPAAGIMMLMAVYTSAVYGGSISAILLHCPGTPASAATALDGYELTKLGKANTALRVSTIASAIGGLVSAIALLTLSPPLSLLSLRFGPPEYFLLAIFGLAVIGSLTSGTIVKGLMAGAFGLFLGTVGVDINVGFPRFTFGFFQLQSGISLVPAMIGLFSLAQILTMSEEGFEDQAGIDKPDLKKIKFNGFLPKLSEIKEELAETWRTILRSSIIGIFVGMLPGAGGDIASWIGYNEAKRASKTPEKFGKGALEGVAGSEAANNAVTGSAMIPLLTLGIPGSAAAAVLLGGLMIHGLIPGRELFTTYGTITYTAMFGFVLANILMGIVGLLAARYTVLVTNVPKKIIMPIIVAFCVIGSYAIGNNTFDVWVMLFFGLFGYLLRKNGFHPAPIILGLILGPMAEIRYTQSMVLARGNLLGFIFGRPLSVFLLVLIVITVVGPILMQRKQNKKEAIEGTDA